jgi:hypothetical protein
MLELLGTVFGSIFSGGATGLIGVAIQRWADYKNRQLDIQIEREKRETEIAKRKADAEIMREEYSGKLKVAQEEGATARDVADSQAFAQTLLREPERFSNAATVSGGQQWILVLLDAFRGSVRPLLTIYLCALMTFVWYQVRQELAGIEIGPQAALDVWRMVVANILYLTTTVVLWWFGTRNKGPQPKVMTGG